MFVDIESDRYVVGEFDDWMESALINIRLVQRGDDFRKGYQGGNIPDDSKYVVWVHYSTGDTFGSSEEAKVLEGFTTLEEAHDFIKIAKGNVGDESYDFTYNGKRHFRSWEGYFERLIKMHADPVPSP